MIVVTGRGLAPPIGDAVYAATEIGRERILSSASGRLEDVLRDVAGLQQFRRSDARTANPTSQGLTLRGLGGNASSRALLILDGVPQTDPFGGWISLPAYAPERLARVRVTRGAASGVFGRARWRGRSSWTAPDRRSWTGWRRTWRTAAATQWMRAWCWRAGRAAASPACPRTMRA